jgi:5-formyltetrahydrofolate cyclo-ligase
VESYAGPILQTAFFSFLRGEILMSSSQAVLREQGRSARQNLSSEYRQAASKTIVEWLKKNLVSVKRIAIYLPIGFEIGGSINLFTEVDLSELLEWGWARQKEISLPLVRGNQLIFVPVTPTTCFEKSKWNILEPIVSDAFNGLDLTDLEVICLPLVAFDEELNRIGQGKGFYDRTLARCARQANRPRFIGCAFECQKVSQIFAQSHDVRLDAIITEKRLYADENSFFRT